MDDDSGHNTSGSPMKGFTPSGQGSTSTPGPETEKQNSGNDGQANTSQAVVGEFGTPAAFAGFGKTEVKPVGDQPHQNFLNQSTQATTPNGPFLGQTTPAPSTSVSNVFTGPTNQTQGFRGFGASSTAQTKPVQNIFSPSSTSTAPKPPASVFGGTGSKQPSDLQTSKHQPKEDIHPQNQSSNMFGPVHNPSSGKPLFSFPEKTGSGSLPKEADISKGDQKTNSSSSELPEAFSESGGQSNTSKLFGQKLSEVKGSPTSASNPVATNDPSISGTPITSAALESSKGTSTPFGQPNTSTPGLFSIPPSQTAAPSFLAGLTPSTPNGNNLMPPRQSQNVQSDDPFTGPKTNSLQSSQPANKSLSSSSSRNGEAAFGQDRQRSVGPASIAPTNPANTENQSAPTSNIFAGSKDSKQIASDAGISSGTTPKPNDSLPNKPAQKITFSSRGPSHVPGYLDNETRVEVDIGHRLRSLNEGLVKFLSQLDPESVDFGRAIEYYCDARQALGKPLKFHQRAAAGEKRKGAELQRDEEFERAAKRQKGVAEQNVTPIKSASSVQPETSPSSTTPRAPPPKLASDSEPGDRTSRTSSTLKNLLSPPESTSDGPQPLTKPGVFGQQSNVSASSRSSTRTGFSSATSPAIASNAPVASHAQTSNRRPDTNIASKGPWKRTSDEYERDEHARDKHSRDKDEHDDESNVETENAPEARKRHRLNTGAAKNISNGAFQSPSNKESASHTPNNENSQDNVEVVSDDDTDTESDSGSDQGDDETGDPSYDPDGGIDGEPEDSNESESEGEEGLDSQPKYEFGKGPSLFDRITYPNTAPTQPIAEDSQQSSTNSASESKQSSVFGNTGFGSANGAGLFSQNSSKSIFGTSDSNQSRLSGASSPAPGKENESSGQAAKQAKPSLFKTTPLTGFANAPSPVPSKSLSNGSIFGSSPATSNPEPNNSTVSFGSSFGKEIPGSGLFGSRPATPTPSAEEKPRTSGTGFSVNSESSRVDHTFKHDSPIRFASSHSEPAPSFTFTSASPSQAEKKDASSTSSVKPLSTLFGESNEKSPLANQTQKPTALGFAFGSHLKPDSNLGVSSSDVSSITSVNSSRATSPGITDTDEGTDGAEEGNDEQIPSLMAARPGEEDENVLYEAPKAKAFKMDKDGAWKSVALGSFRVLRPKTSGKTRMLLRADPGAHIILNAFLVPFVNYKALTPTTNSKIGAVQFIVPIADGKPENWLIKMKGVELAQELASVLENNKQ